MVTITLLEKEQLSLRRPAQGDMVQKPHRTEHGNALTEQRMAGLED
ncbi:MAG: hypothetical protein KDI50_09155 [Candidatus Competibacteraceae bacterium]|nr:hypothetical protein [Candidatus Competibacteraceae bacterium]